VIDSEFLRRTAHDLRAFFIPSGMFAGPDAFWITAERGSNSDSQDRGDDVTSRDHIAIAEVAEWQTQRTQNSDVDEPDSTITRDSALSDESTPKEDRTSDEASPRAVPASNVVYLAQRQRGGR
jgi:hypothetical protein